MVNFKNNRKLDIKKSRNGSGLFSKVNFKKDDVVLEVVGKFITGDVDEYIDDEIRSNAYRFSRELYISPSGELADLINHSCKPNSKVVKKNKKLFIEAIGNINKGDEIVLDYSTIIASDDIWKMKCNCGEDVCRKNIGKFKSLPKKLKDLYISEGIVPSYILRIL